MTVYTNSTAAGSRNVWAAVAICSLFHVTGDASTLHTFYQGAKGHLKVISDTIKLLGLPD